MLGDALPLSEDLVEGVLRRCLLSSQPVADVPVEEMLRAVDLLDVSPDHLDARSGPPPSASDERPERRTRSDGAPEPEGESELTLHDELREVVWKGVPAGAPATAGAHGTTLRRVRRPRAEATLVLLEDDSHTDSRSPAESCGNRIQPSDPMEAFLSDGNTRRLRLPRCGRACGRDAPYGRFPALGDQVALAVATADTG